MREPAGISHRSLAVLLTSIFITQVGNTFWLHFPEYGPFWQRIVLATELFQPAALFYVGIQFLSSASGGYRSRLWAARVLGIMGLLLALLAMTDRFVTWETHYDQESAIVMGPWGHVPYVFVIFGMALALAQLELILRASSEPVRYRMKVIVIGLGGLAAYQICQASQMLLVPVWRPAHTVVSSVVVIISLSLIAHGLIRSGGRKLLVNAYVSHQALFGSLTFIAIGLYLLAVGAVGQWLRSAYQPLGPELNGIAIFAAMVLLAIVVLSKTVRAELRRFVTRNFHRPKYDYRAQWIRVTKAFQAVTHKETILDASFDLLIKTFSTTIIAIWVFREGDMRFCQLRPATDDKEPMELTHPVIRQLLQRDDAVMIKDAVEASDPLIQSGAELCYPIRAKDRLVAFIVLGKQTHQEAYGIDDCDLLSGICHHMGALLSNANLAEERQAAAELEALHRFSVFCLHDLKNLAARLSLVAQNAELHGTDPAFHESAMRTVADTARKMTGLISKLSLQSFQPTVAGEAGFVEISRLVEELVTSFKEDGMVQLQVIGGPIRPVMAVRDQIHQVLLNVVLNARHAITQKGDISIVLEQSDSSVAIKIRDTGIGIPPSMLDTLFRPSQSSRPGGLGIGLYQCKRIVESHGGTIQIRSEEGKGTLVQIELPLPADGGTSPVMAHTAMSS
jgi:putative PEP-CTERM system histidine kinase